MILKRSTIWKFQITLRIVKKVYIVLTKGWLTFFYYLLYILLTYLNILGIYQQGIYTYLFSRSLEHIY